MSEQIYTYSLKNKNEVFIQDRDDYYQRQVDEFHKNGKTIEAVEVVNVFLFNTDGEILIQKRGKSKNHNAGLLDKSLGGHIKFGDNPNFTVMVETVQELQTPSIVLRNVLDFEKTRKMLKKYQENIAIIKLLAVDFFTLKKVINSEEIPIVNKVHLYMGIYNGTTKPSDKEAAGVLYYSLGDLREEMKQFPQRFTYDLHFYIERFGKDMEDFVKHIKK